MQRTLGLLRRMSSLSAIPEVDIETNNKYKYILVKLIAGVEDKVVVRGYSTCEYHNDINKKLEVEMANLITEGKLPQCKSEVLGGGKIVHDGNGKTIKVYGESQGYGKADHKVTVSILKRNLPEFNVFIGE